MWFQNSVRGAAGLAVAVYIAQRTGLQHSFWVVLGTLSVLRSNALGTGWSIVSALAGTAVGIVVGALLVIGIGTHEAVLWGVLPVAILLAAYAPRAISFAAGQAGFTVVLFVLFNLIQPVGWRVGLVRVEDVAIGFAISLGVGLLFWPRGAGALLREDLADRVRARRGLRRRHGPAADRRRRLRRALLAQGVPQTPRSTGSTTPFGSTSPSAPRPGSTSRTSRRSSAARRASAGQRSRSRRSDAWWTATRGSSACGENLDREIHALQSWYVTLGYALVNDRPVPPPHIRDAEGRSRLLACVRDAARGRDEATAQAALVLLWASQHLDNLWRLEAHLGERARAVDTVSTDLGNVT